MVTAGTPIHASQYMRILCMRHAEVEAELIIMVHVLWLLLPDSTRSPCSTASCARRSQILHSLPR